MDHKGPEHHYDEIDCPECGAFFQQGEIQPETVHNNCPECGYDLRSSTGGRPYRGQPSPINSEMTERNTPLDGASNDRGGNPLGEGILAGLKDKMDWEEIAELDEATEPAGLGETHPVKDNQWKPGDRSDRSMGRDEMLGSVRNSGEHSWSDPGDDNNQELWDQVVEDFENAKAEPHQSTNKIAAAPWLDEEPDNFPVEQLGWDIVEVVEPSKELTEAVNKYSMPMPEGITDNLHEALIAVNAWVENPEENGKLRPYKEYWSVIRPKITQGNVRIGVEDPHMADIINDVARTNSLSALDKTSSVKVSLWLAALPELAAGLAAGTAGIGDVAGVALPAIAGHEALKGAEGAVGELGDTGGGPDYNMIGQNTAPKMATYGDEYEHPSSITKRIEDPENIDPHQRSDESNDDWAYDMLDVNEIGSTHDPRGKDDARERIKRQFAASESNELSKALQQFVDSFPLIMEYFNSDESGLDDPIIKSVHEGLESEFPGYLNLAVPPEENKILIMFDDKNKKESNTGPSCFQCGMPADGPGGLCENHAAESDETATAKKGPAAATHSVQTLADTWNLQNPQQQVQNQMNKTLKQLGITASNTQGPHTDEQQNAFIEHLHEMFEAGKLDEEQVAQLENMMFNEPSNPEVTKIWSEIANQDELFDAAPEDMAPSPQEQMQGMGAPGMPPAPGGDMGMGGPPGPAGPAPGIPDMSAPTPADLNPAGPGAMPPPIMSSVRNDMLKSILKHAADSAASTCPKCDGHTTGVVNQSTGKCECRSCGHKWNDKNLIPSDGTSTDTSTTSSFYQALNLDEGPMEVMPGSVDSFSEPEELEEDDSTHTWADDSGEPLEEGKEYEIYAHNYEIPDVGRVVEVKPDSIVYEIESNGGLRTTIEIDRQEADLNGYRFVSTDFGSEENPAGIEENMDSKPVPVPGESTDLSTPHIQIGSKVAGKHYTPMQQRELIDEYGEARNADKLNLEGTHYADSDPDYFLFGC